MSRIGSDLEYRSAWCRAWLIVIVALLAAVTVNFAQATDLKMRRTVRLALWTGSEQGLLGSRAYVTHHFADPGTTQPKPEHQGMSVYFNVDGGTGAMRGVYLHGNQAASRCWKSGWRRSERTA